MFKSSFAQEMLQEQRQHRHLQQEILPKELLEGGQYKSQFAASTHGPLDNVNIDSGDDNTVSRRRHKTFEGTEPARQQRFEGNEPVVNSSDLLHTSDLGTSDFSSSELWPPSTSSSPFEGTEPVAGRSKQRFEGLFEYAPRYRSTSFRQSSSPGSNNSNGQQQQGSFLNLQSSMQFSYLKRVRYS